MRFEVDQSGKVEQSNLDTVITFANERCDFSVFISKKLKNKLYKEFESKTTKSKQFRYKFFAYLIALGVMSMENISEIMIDLEYVGHEPGIKIYILQFLAKMKLNKNIDIYFGRVTKHSQSHIISNAILNRKRKANLEIKIDQVSKYWN